MSTYELRATRFVFKGSEVNQTMTTKLGVGLHLGWLAATLDVAGLALFNVLVNLRGLSGISTGASDDERTQNRNDC